MSPLKLVLDTNVVISALIWGGLPYRIIGAATEGDIALFTSDALLAELHDVLVRPHLAERLSGGHVEIGQLVTQYSELAHRWRCRARQED
jgi:putative PIN family toxin of toxin-antitoxin system